MASVRPAFSGRLVIPLTNASLRRRRSPNSFPSVCATLVAAMHSSESLSMTMLIPVRLRLDARDVRDDRVERVMPKVEEGIIPREAVKELLVIVNVLELVNVLGDESASTPTPTPLPLPPLWL